MLLWGTHPLVCARFEGTDKLVETAEDILEARGFVKSKQVVGIVAGTATKTGSYEPSMRLHVIGDR